MCIHHSRSIIRFAVGTIAAFAALVARPALAYEYDVHFALTYYMARAVGFTPTQSIRIATLDASVDTSEATDPAPTDLSVFSPEKYRVRVTFHAFLDTDRWPNATQPFPPHIVPIGPRLVDPLFAHDFSEANRARGLESAVLGAHVQWAKKNGGNPGVLLHYVQDIYGHWGYGAGGGHAVARSGLPAGLSGVRAHITDNPAYEPYSMPEMVAPDVRDAFQFPMHRNKEMVRQSLRWLAEFHHSKRVPAGAEAECLAVLAKMQAVTPVNREFDAAAQEASAQVARKALHERDDLFTSYDRAAYGLFPWPDTNTLQCLDWFNISTFSHDNATELRLTSDTSLEPLTDFLYMTLEIAVDFPLREGSPVVVRVAPSKTGEAGEVLSHTITNGTIRVPDCPVGYVEVSCTDDTGHKLRQVIDSYDAGSFGYASLHNPCVTNETPSYLPTEMIPSSDNIQYSYKLELSYPETFDTQYTYANLDSESQGGFYKAFIGEVELTKANGFEWLHKPIFVYESSTPPTGPIVLMINNVPYTLGWCVQYTIPVTYKYKYDQIWTCSEYKQTDTLSVDAQCNVDMGILVHAPLRDNQPAGLLDDPACGGYRIEKHPLYMQARCVKLKVTGSKHVSPAVWERCVKSDIRQETWRFRRDEFDFEVVKDAPPDVGEVGSAKPVREADRSLSRMTVRWRNATLGDGVWEQTVTPTRQEGSGGGQVRSGRVRPGETYGKGLSKPREDTNLNVTRKGIDLNWDFCNARQVFTIDNNLRIRSYKATGDKKDSFSASRGSIVWPMVEPVGLPMTP